MRKLLRTHFTTIVVAMITAAVTAGGPVLAEVIADYAKDADRVDDRHAVGAGASVADRARKLVATDPDGRLPNNIILKAPDANKLDGHDSSQFVRATQEPWKSVEPAEAGPAGESVCTTGHFCSRTVIETNYWLNYGDGYATVAFYKDAFGIVHLKGVAKQTSAAALGKAFRLPVGYRPTTTRIFSGVGSADAYRAAWNVSPARIDIANTGIVSVFTACAGDTDVCSADGRTYISFEGISFRTDG